MHTDPQPVSILYGSRSAPYMRLDPYFMPAITDDRPARAAFDRLVALLDRSIQDRVLRAHHDGTDRWLKRVSVSNDLRRSRELRGAATSRLIG